MYPLFIGYFSDVVIKYCKQVTQGRLFLVYGSYGITCYDDRAEARQLGQEVAR